MIVKGLIEEFLSKDVNVTDYRNALGLLKKCGFIELIRKLGHPSVINNGSDLNAMAHEGSWSNGFQTAFNQLEYFEKLYANKHDLGQSLTAPTFGGAQIAKREGYLSEQEIELARKK